MSPGAPELNVSEGRTRFVRLETLSPKTAEAVNTLYEKGARLFRLSDENKPAESRGFYGRQLSLDDLLEHLERRGRLGIEPASINTVCVDVDAGDPDRFFQAFRPLSVYESKTKGRCHAFYAHGHDGGKVRPRPFTAPLFRISGDLRHGRSFVALYDAPRLAEDLSNGSLGVPYQEVEKALVTGSLAAQGGQRRALAPPVGSKDVADDLRPSPSYQRHNWILGKLTAARSDGVQGQALRRYARKLHTGLVQTPGLVPHHFELSEALSIAAFVSARSWSVEHQRAAGIRSGQARRAKSAGRDRRILALLNAGHSIRRTAAIVGASSSAVGRVKDRQRARTLG